MTITLISARLLLFSFVSVFLSTVRRMKALKHIKVWDPLVRIFHWSLATCFLIAYLLEDERLNLHVLAGSTLFGLVIFRLVWGVIGTRHSRFADFACSFREVKAHLSDLVHLRPAYHPGHTPAGSVMIILLLAGLLVLSLSGVMLYGMEDGSPRLGGLVAGMDLKTALLVEDVHDLTADLLALLVLFHVAGVLAESLLQRQNLVRSMITGYKTEKKENI